jgi:hypothetical protein
MDNVQKHNNFINIQSSQLLGLTQGMNITEYILRYT